jgi:hypothetical protein
MCAMPLMVSAVEPSIASPLLELLEQFKRFKPFKAFKFRAPCN